MATRTRTTAKKTAKKSQVEINRIKPVGVLSLDTLKEKSSRVITINVLLPDGEVYEFYHLPVTVEVGEAFFEAKDESNLSSMTQLLSEILANKDGSQFATVDDLRVLDTQIIAKLMNAIFESTKDEPGED